MTTLRHDSHVLHTKVQRPFLIDLTFTEDGTKKPVVIFVHGFKGFKDWGPFPLLSDEMARRGLACIKVNLSHNGTTPETPQDFSDLEAFGRDTFSQQLDDLATVIDWLTAEKEASLQELNVQEIYLLGHSRGGSLVLLKAAEDERVRKVVTWSAVADLTEGYSEEELRQWKKEGVRYIVNGRTKQTMPLYYNYYEDLLQHADRLSVLKATHTLKQPLLILHGSVDETVPVVDAQRIHEKASNSTLSIIDGAGHTFGGTHPFNSDILPEPFKEALQQSITFFKRSFFNLETDRKTCL